MSVFLFLLPYACLEEIRTLWTKTNMPKSPLVLGLLARVCYLAVCKMIAGGNCISYFWIFIAVQIAKFAKHCVLFLRKSIQNRRPHQLNIQKCCICKQKDLYAGQNCKLSVKHKMGKETYFALLFSKIP